MAAELQPGGELDLTVLLLQRRLCQLGNGLGRQDPGKHMTSDCTGGEAELAKVGKREEGEEVVKQLRRQLEQVRTTGSQSY